VAEVDEGLFQGAAQQQRGEARAVEVQVAGHHAPIGQCEPVHAAVGTPRDLDDPPFGAAHAPSQRQRAQKGGVQRGIEVIRVVVAVFFARDLEAALTGHHARQALFVQAAEACLAQPAVLAPYRGRAAQVAEIAEGVEIPFTARAPVAKLDAQLVTAVGGAQELGLVDAEQAVEVADRGKGRLPYPDNADFLRFDQFDGGPLQGGDERGGRHPSGRAAADHHDAVEW
jgi:hypothetical protein